MLTIWRVLTYGPDLKVGPVQHVKHFEDEDRALAHMTFHALANPNMPKAEIDELTIRTAGELVRAMNDSCDFHEQ